MNYILEHLDDFYYSFPKPKIDHITGKVKRNTNGEEEYRIINAPIEELKIIQKRIYKYIITKVDLPSYIYMEVQNVKIIFVMPVTIKVTNTFLRQI